MIRTPASGRVASGRRQSCGSRYWSSQSASTSAVPGDRSDEFDRVGDRVEHAAGPERVPLDVGDVVDPVSTRIVSSPASMPATTSVSIRSPTMTVLSECASIRFMRAAEHHRVRLADEVGLAAGGLGDQRRDRSGGGQSGPPADGPVTSGLVAMKRAPPPISRIALVIASNE